MRYVISLVLVALLGCTPTNSTESKVSTDSIRQDSVQAAPEKPTSKEQVTEASPVVEFPFSNENLMAFSFTTHVDEAIFAEGGRFVLTNISDGSQKTGTWLDSDDTLKITVDGNTARYVVETFGPDDCELVANDEFSAKLFPKGPFDYSAEGTTHLFRNTLSAPFPKESLHGQWSDPIYGTGFSPGGKFGHSEPDCWTEGSWKFDGEDLTMRVTKSNCDVPAPRHVKVLRLSRKQMIMQNDDGSLEVWIRQG